MQENNKNKKIVSDNELERQKMIDEGGTQKYGGKDKSKTKDDNILIDSEH
ncbi:MAG: hypothetical protein M3Q77_09200 [Thermoproteota archaeon]|nr:hypothetical protein [Nitrosopumilus sp.]MDQ3084971.1 hypothetical protein [Thermoproteota archaeon]